MKKKKEVTAKPKARKTTQTKPATMKALNEVDYVHLEGHFGKFEVRKTANAWWGSQFNGPLKLIEFLNAIKMDMPTLRASAYAGLTRNQIEYFLRLHPEISTILPPLRESVNIAATANIAKAVMGSKKEGILPSLETSKWVAERRMKAEYSIRTELTGADGKGLTDLDDEHQARIANAVLKSIEAKKKIENE